MMLRVLLIVGGFITAVHAADEGATARKDAADQAREGDITRWIEFYKTEREKLPADAAKGRDDHSVKVIIAPGEKNNDATK